MTRGRAGCVGSVALLVLLAGCGTPRPSTPAASATTGADCAQLIVIGARGSTQNPDLNDGVGTEVRRTVDALKTRLARRSDVSVHLTPVRYDAARTATQEEYLRHTAAGSRLMSAQLRSQARRCPDSRFALIGFSQGAQVVHGAAARMPASLARRVALVAMIADPITNPDDPIAHWSYARQPTTRTGRLGAGPLIDPDLRDVAISLCVAGDEICNARGAPGEPTSDTHRHFYERPAAVKVTAARLDAVLRRAGI